MKTSPELSLAQTAFITFYSFKGGVGRSMAMINVAGILAGRGFRVLAIDFDLEAPGISYLTEPQTQESPLGVVDALNDILDRGAEADLAVLSPVEVVEKYSFVYDLPEELRVSDEGLLRIMPSGRAGDDYPARLDRLGLGRLYQSGRGKPIIEEFKKTIQEAKYFDFVMIDSRTGFSDEGGICTRDLADYLVVVMGLNRQNVRGTADFLAALRRSDAQTKGLRVVLSPIPNGEDELVEARETEAKKQLSKAWGKEIDLSLHIPYHPRLALTEEPHVFRRSRGYLYEAYMKVEKAMTAMVGLDQVSIDRRLQEAWHTKNASAIIHELQLLAKLGHHVNEWLFPPKVFEAMLTDPEHGDFRKRIAPLLPKTGFALLNAAAVLSKAKLEEAELFYQRLVGTDDDNANVLGNYANFLKNVRGDHDGAERLYKRALELQPDHANVLGNYAQLLFVLRRDEEAVDHLERAFASEPDAPELLCELHFYACAHIRDRYLSSLSTLKDLLTEGKRAAGWSLDDNVRVLRESGDEHADFIAALAQVVSDSADITTLTKFEPWQRGHF